jgi:hypothetical protein
VISQPTPKVRRKNTADLEQRHQYADIGRTKLLRLEVQTPIWHKRTNKEVVNKVKTGQLKMEFCVHKQGEDGHKKVG